MEYLLKELSRKNASYDRKSNYSNDKHVVGEHWPDEWHHSCLMTMRRFKCNAHYRRTVAFIRRWNLFQYLARTGGQFHQTRSAWSMDQGSNKKRSAVHNLVPTVTKFCVMWEGLSPPHDTKFGNCRSEIFDRIMIFICSLIHGSSWSDLIKVGPGGQFRRIWAWRIPW